MAITDAYADNTRYKAIIGKTKGDNDSEIDLQLAGASRLLDEEIGRFFTQDATAVARRYYPRTENQRTLFVDDIATAAGLVVKVDDNRDGVAEVTLTLTTDFELQPFNAPFGPAPEPYTQLYLPPRSKRAFWWEIVEVTAIFGWPAIPRAIVEATCELTSLFRMESPRATSQIIEGFNTLLATSPSAQTIIDRVKQAYAKPYWVYS